MTNRFRLSQFEQSKRLSATDITVAMLIAGLVAAVLFCLVAIFPAVWTVMTEMPSRQQADVRQCVELNDEIARLECFDKRTPKTLPHPAKGANAPISLFGRSASDVDGRAFHREPEPRQFSVTTP
jgi:hypothetical protein